MQRYNNIPWCGMVRYKKNNEDDFRYFQRGYQFLQLVNESQIYSINLS